MSDTIASVARKVTLFEDRAEVVRVARVTLSAGSQWLSVGGVTAYLDDRSLQARLPAAAGQVVAARVRRRVHHEQALGSAALAALEAELRAAEAEVALVAATDERLEATRTQLRLMLEKWLEAIAVVPRFAADPERLGEWRAAYAALAAAADAAGAQGHPLVERRRTAALAQERAEQRLGEGLALTPRRDTVVEVNVDAAKAGEAELELVYRTPCALWRPEHLARLHGGASPTIELTSYATAWQCTGERWDEVEVSFSTARPGAVAEPPRLRDDLLTQRKKTDDEKKRLVVEAREQAIAVAGLDQGARAVAEMPGVDDGGEPLVFAPAARVSLASDGRPFRIEIARRSLAAETALVVLPELAPAAHLRARASHTGGGAPLLAGPVTVARAASLVGRGKLGFVAAGDPFELGFGVADEIRVRRAVDEESDTAALTGKQLCKRKVRLYLSNLSAEARRVELTERIPVSEIEEVQVELTDAAWQKDGKDGFARRTVELAAHEHRALTLEYEIRAAARVTLPF